MHLYIKFQRNRLNSNFGCIICGAKGAVKLIIPPKSFEIFHRKFEPKSKNTENFLYDKKSFNSCKVQKFLPNPHIFWEPRSQVPPLFAPLQQTSGNMEGSRIVNGYGCLYAQVKNCPDIKEGDVIGCCMNSENGSCFFTLNGMKLEPKITNINMNNQYYPIVALERGASLEVSFGDHPFLFQEANKVQLDSRLDLFADQLKAKFKNNISSPAKSFCDYLYTFKTTFKT